jgi:hypothetical protein
MASKVCAVFFCGTMLMNADNAAIHHQVLQACISGASEVISFNQTPLSDHRS